jgi:hypothetical protein
MGLGRPRSELREAFGELDHGDVFPTRVELVLDSLVTPVCESPRPAGSSKRCPGFDVGQSRGRHIRRFEPELVDRHPMLLEEEGLDERGRLEIEVQ